MPVQMSGADAYMAPARLSTKTAIRGKSPTELDMNDFMNLLVAQMTNQDMLNPTTDTEFIAQMAQFTTLQGINTIQEYQLSSYAASYVGKTVSIAHIGDTGNLTKAEGIVSAVTFYEGQPQVVVDNVKYPLFSVMEIKVPATTKPEETTKPEDTTEPEETTKPEGTEGAGAGATE